MSTPLSAMRTRYGGRWAALIAVTAGLLVPLGAAPPVAAAPQAPPAAAAPDCVKTPRSIPVTGGTLSVCVLRNNEPYLAFTNTGRAFRDLSVVVYDCSGVQNGQSSTARCQETLTGALNLIWRQIKGGDTVSVELTRTQSASHLYWTADATTTATAMKPEGAAWIY
ncbi:hypothetical protein ABZ714_27760 [Streptomyces sp. NPDC006798]|uniref:hypothetical protein n=1 Tax=Streptomyces sp. NPDC006798 TaxID=3155462 RepID=UPI00340447D5